MRGDRRYCEDFLTLLRTGTRTQFPTSIMDYGQVHQNLAQPNPHNEGLECIVIGDLNAGQKNAEIDI